MNEKNLPASRSPWQKGNLWHIQCLLARTAVNQRFIFLMLVIKRLLKKLWEDGIILEDHNDSCIDSDTWSKESPTMVQRRGCPFRTWHNSHKNGVAIIQMYNNSHSTHWTHHNTRCHPRRIKIGEVKNTTVRRALLTCDWENWLICGGGLQRKHYYSPLPHNHYNDSFMHCAFVVEVKLVCSSFLFFYPWVSKS